MTLQTRPPDLPPALQTLPPDDLAALLAAQAMIDAKQAERAAMRADVAGQAASVTAIPSLADVMRRSTVIGNQGIAPLYQTTPATPMASGGTSLPRAEGGSDTAKSQATSTRRKPTTVSKATGRKKSQTPPLELRAGESVADGMLRRLAQRRAEARSALEAEWREATRGFAGDCAACLDSGRDYQTRDYCACARGVRLERQDSKRLEAEARQRVALAYAHALERSGMPPDYEALTLESYPRASFATAELRRALEAWDGRRGFILSGPYGVGKTALACAVMREVARRECERDPSARFHVRVWVVAKLLRELRAAMGDRSGAYAAILREAASARVVLLDDLGRANADSEWVSETLFDLVNERYNAGLATLVTTNYAEAALLPRLGEHGGAIMDRLVTRNLWLSLSGSSLRKRATL